MTCHLGPTSAVAPKLESVSVRGFLLVTLLAQMLSHAGRESLDPERWNLQVLVTL